MKKGEIYTLNLKTSLGTFGFGEHDHERQVIIEECLDNGDIKVKFLNSYPNITWFACSQILEPDVAAKIEQFLKILD